MTLDDLKARCEIEEHTDCWLWQHCITRSGTPQTWDGKRVVPARRYAYELATGKAVPRHLWCISPCDDQRCINPAHTKVTNRSGVVRNARRQGKEWMHSGTKAKIALAARSRSRLDWEKVRTIRRSDKSAVALAAEFGVSDSAVRGVRQGRTWREPGLALMFQQLRRAA